MMHFFQKKSKNTDNAKEHKTIARSFPLSNLTDLQEKPFNWDDLHKSGTTNPKNTHSWTNKSGQHVLASYKIAYSPLVWIIAALISIAFTVTVVGLNSTYKYTYQNAVMKKTFSFWEKSYFLNTNWETYHLNTEAITINNPQLDPVGNYILDQNHIYSMQGGYLINKGSISSEYGIHNFKEVLDGVAMFNNKSAPFVDIETLRPIPSPCNAQVINPLGIYSHDLIVAQIQCTKNDSPTTVAFNRHGKIVWKYNGYCSTAYNKKPQLVLLGGCVSHKNEFIIQKHTRLIDVRNGIVREISLDKNEYLKLADDHMYIVNASTDTLRYLDDDLVPVPAGKLTLDELNNYQVIVNGYKVFFNTFNMQDRMTGIDKIQKTINANKNDANSNKSYLVSVSGDLHTITSNVKCANPLFVQQGKAYICSFVYSPDQKSIINDFALYATDTNEKINDLGQSGEIARYNNGLALININSSTGKVKFTYIK